MPPKPWKTLSTRPIYQNNWISVREDIAQLPNGRTTICGVVSMNVAVGVLPFVDDDHVLLVRQYRYPHAENQRWEIPTGAVHPDETSAQGALRELQEEAGYTASQLTAISIFYPSNSVCHETAHLFIARGLTPAPLPPDDTEDLEIATFPFAEVIDMVRRSEIRDSLSMLAILLAEQQRTCPTQQSST